MRRYKAMDFGSMDIAEMFEDGINIIKSNWIAIPSGAHNSISQYADD